MTNQPYQTEDRARPQKRLEDEAIAYARNSQWEDAVTKNREVLDLFPDDVSAYNRLGKALSELGQYAEAKRAYSDALVLDPENNIARKNVERLAQVREEAGNARGKDRIDPRLFIEETGKTGFTKLVDVAPAATLARVAAGDQVHLRREGSLLFVENAGGERLGRVEPRLANRLIKFMGNGNQYAAGVAELNDHDVRLIIRETFQDPKQFGKVSFPTQVGAESVRPSVRDSLLRYDRDDEDSDDTDDSDDDDDDEKADVELEESDLLEPEE